MGEVACNFPLGCSYYLYFTACQSAKSFNFNYLLAAVLGFLNYGLFFIIGKVLELIKHSSKENNSPESFSKELEKAELNQAKEEDKDSFKI